MPLSFSEVVPTTRKPGVYAEFNNSRAVQGINRMPMTGLLIGHRLSSGTVGLLTLTKLSKDQATLKFGAGSMLANQAAAWFSNNDVNDVYAMAIAEPSGAAATYTLTISGTSTESGSAVVYVGGKRYSTAVASGTTNIAVAVAIAATINADTSLIATAAAFSGVVTITLRHLGTFGNDLDVRVNYYEGEVLPAGISIVVAAGVAGSGDPVVSAIFVPLADKWINAFAIPFFDATNLTAIETEMVSRQNAYRQIGGYTFAWRNSAYATVQTLGNSRNAIRHSIMGSTGLPTTPWESAAALAGQIAKAIAIDPARPVQTLPIVGVLAPKISDRYSWSDGNSNLYSGISTFNVGSDGSMLIDRVIATYKVNPAGAADPSWLDINTGYTLDQIRYDVVTLFKLRYPRHKLAKDGTRYGAGQAVLTPSDIKGELVTRFGLWEAEGWAQDVEQFKRDLIVEINSSDPSRADVLLPVKLVGGLRVAAFSIQFLQ